MLLTLEDLEFQFSNSGPGVSVLISKSHLFFFFVVMTRPNHESREDGTSVT